MEKGLLTLYMPKQQLFFFLSFSGCWNCGGWGHVKSQCPSKEMKTREKRGRGATAGRSRGGAGIRGRGGLPIRGRFRPAIRGRGRLPIRGRGGPAIRGRGGSAVQGRGASGERGTMRGRGNRHVTINRGRVINIYYK